MILGVRGLDTGFAKDVSGVLRTSRGAATVSTDSGLDHEYLFFVENDGGAKIFERGS